MISQLSPALAILSLALHGATASPLPKPWTVGNQIVYNGSKAITWGPCPEELSTAPNVQCATYRVPLDWNDAEGNETIELGMLRIEAADKENRIGNLFINPGGPGAPATQLAGAIALAPPELGIGELTDRFDIIALDPRGVGLSSPIQCDPGVFNERVTLFPQTQDEYDALVAHNLAVRESCRAKTGPLLDYVDTISAARDFEAVRLALGGEKVSFLGLSYGTQLFSQYAELFPGGVRALVLDGNLQHSQAESSNLLIESAAYEMTLKRFFAWCGENGDECALGSRDAAQQAWLDVLAKAAGSPIPAPECDDGPKTGCRSTATEEEVRFNAQGLLISPADWPTLAQALAGARDDNNATLLSQAQPIAVGDAYADSLLFGGNAIQCLDWSHGAESLALVQEKETLGATFSPLTRGASQSYTIQIRCIGWPAPTNPETPVSYDGDAAVLMVNSNYDPSTSYVWALGLQSELGDNTVLLTRNGTGHTSFFLGGETTAAEIAYLVNLTLPDAGTVLDS